MHHDSRDDPSDIEARLDRELAAEIASHARDAGLDSGPGFAEGDESEYGGRSEGSWSFARYAWMKSVAVGEWGSVCGGWGGGVGGGWVG
jgi:hypothetical protein